MKVVVGLSSPPPLWGQLDDIVFSLHLVTGLEIINDFHRNHRLSRSPPGLTYLAVTHPSKGSDRPGRGRWWWWNQGIRELMELTKLMEWMELIGWCWLKPENEGASSSWGVVFKLRRTDFRGGTYVGASCNKIIISIWFSSQPMPNLVVSYARPFPSENSSPLQERSHQNSGVFRATTSCPSSQRAPERSLRRPEASCSLIVQLCHSRIVTPTGKTRVNYLICLDLCISCLFKMYLGVFSNRVIG